MWLSISGESHCIYCLPLLQRAGYIIEEEKSMKFTVKRMVALFLALLLAVPSFAFV